MQLLLITTTIPQFRKGTLFCIQLHQPCGSRENKMKKQTIKVITKLPNSEQYYKGKVKTHPTISLEMPVPSQGHYGFHSFPVVD
jgi:hypothetical protein